MKFWGLCFVHVPEIVSRVNAFALIMVSYAQTRVPSKSLKTLCVLKLKLTKLQIFYLLMKKKIVYNLTAKEISPNYEILYVLS